MATRQQVENGHSYCKSHGWRGQGAEGRHVHSRASCPNHTGQVACSEPQGSPGKAAGKWAVCSLRTSEQMAQQTQGITEKKTGNRNSGSTDKEAHRMPPVTSSSKPQQIHTEWVTWQSSGQERCSLIYLFYIYNIHIHRGRKITGCQGWGSWGEMGA